MTETKVKKRFLVSFQLISDGEIWVEAESEEAAEKEVKEGGVGSLTIMDLMDNCLDTDIEILDVIEECRDEDDEPDDEEAA